MVLWEITLATAYFLGLKRTYRLALRLQRRLVSPKHPRIRLFLHGRTRAIFDMAIKVHQSIQERDIEVGRNLGNWILRWLDKIKPSAQIRGHPPTKSTIGGGTSRNAIKQIQSSSVLKLPENSRPLKDQKSSRRLFTSSPITLRQPFPTIAMMLRASNPIGNMTQYRNFSISERARSNCMGGRFEGGVIREDIRQWMLQK